MISNGFVLVTEKGSVGSIPAGVGVAAVGGTTLNLDNVIRLVHNKASGGSTIHLVGGKELVVLETTSEILERIGGKI